MRLEPGETKNGEGRNFPLTPMLREALERQVERTEALERDQGISIPWLFHRDGRQIQRFNRPWKRACAEAGEEIAKAKANRAKIHAVGATRPSLDAEPIGKFLSETKNGKRINPVAYRIPHDFRRSAVKNLETAGVPRLAAMKLVGHKTMSIYSRYAIADQTMLIDAAKKLTLLERTANERLAAKKRKTAV